MAKNVIDNYASSFFGIIVKKCTNPSHSAVRPGKLSKYIGWLLGEKTVVTIF